MIQARSVLGFSAIGLLLFGSVVSGAAALEPARKDAATDDGSARAVSGEAQHPALLSGYATRPPWRVAGVDYRVGRPPEIALKRPTPENLPRGADFRAEAIYVSGHDVTLDGFDLNGLTVMVEDSASGVVTIKNCEANRGVVIRSTVQATAHLVVDHCTLDGGGMASDPDFQTIKVWCPLTVLYSWIKNGPGGIQANTALVAEYNLLEGFAWKAGAHANAIYVRGVDTKTDETLIAFNTIYSQAARNDEGFPVGIGAAIAFFGDGGSFHHSAVSHNVLVSALPGGASYMVGFYVEPGAEAVGGQVANNYFASIHGFNARQSGAFGAFYPGSKGLVQAEFSRNVDMTTGRPIGP